MKNGPTGLNPTYSRRSEKGVGQVRSHLGHSRRWLGSLAAAVLLTIAVPMAALAGGTVNCGSGNLLFTYGTATTSQYHWIDGLGSTGNLGPGSKSRNWGTQSGSKNWDVYGVGITSESANCFIN